MQVMEETAEKAAARASETVKNELLLELSQMEKRLGTEVRSAIRDELGGMTPHEHFAEHLRARKFFNTWDRIRESAVSKVVTTAVIFLLGGGAAFIFLGS